MTTLRVPTEDTWEIQLNRDKHGILWLNEGLTEFFDFYSIANGYLLMLEYAGTSTLNVAIFSNDESEIAYPIRGDANGEKQKTTTIWI
ncbi:B3 domain-containing transcription factor VRN1 [Linum perenne]